VRSVMSSRSSSAAGWDRADRHLLINSAAE
jgi:hypothetical protein